MKCKAECPNTDVCEHGYCPPHRYSYCERKLTPTPMNDTQPTGLDLDELFDKCFYEENFEGARKYAKQALTRWGLEQRRLLVEQIVSNSIHATAGKRPLTTTKDSFIIEKQKLWELAELQANLQGEQS